MATSKFITKTSSQYRDDFLRSVSNALQTIAGIDNPNVSYGTDHYIIGEAIGKIAEMASYNAIVAADAQMADTATGTDLYRIAKIYGLSLRPAGGSTGYLALSASNTAAIASGQQLIDPSGLRYQVIVGGSYSDQDSVPIGAIDTGSGTNIAAGTSLRWVSPPAFVDGKAAVATGGLTGGVDAEGDEGLRSRLLERLRNPSGGGNWAQFAAAAEASSTAVQKAFVYPAYNGPSTVMVSVTGAPTSTNKSRNVNSLLVSGTVTPAVKAMCFEGVEVIVTTVQNYPTMVSIGLALPAAATSSPPGPGGGWLDGSPFPDFSPNSAVYDLTSTTTFTVYSNTAPLDGVSRFVYVGSTWDVFHCKVVSSVAGPAPNLWTVTVDTPCIGIQVGDWIFPDAVNMDKYIEGLLSVFGALGPGEITSNSNLLPYAYRRPYVSTSWNSDIGPSIIKFLSGLGDEVLDVQYLLPASATSPPLPASITDGPYILTPYPSHIGFYPL